MHEKFQTPGTKIEKGDELGIFQFGGSSIILAFQKGRVKFDDDLRDCSKHCIQVSVEVGMSLGVATRPSSREQEDETAEKEENGASSYAEVVKEG